MRGSAVLLGLAVACGGSLPPPGPADASVGVSPDPALAASLVFLAQPSAVEGGANLAPVRIAVLDAAGNVVKAPAQEVVLDVKQGPEGGDFADRSAASTETVDGVATFDRLSFDRPGDYALSALLLSSGPVTIGQRLPTAVSASFHVGLHFTALASGEQFSCGLARGGKAFCWGEGQYGELGAPKGSLDLTPVIVAGGLTFTAITAGTHHVCALTADGTAYCWGHDDVGQLGDMGITDREAPIPVYGELKFVSISAGTSHTCAVTAIGDAWCWGDDSYGQLGNGSRVGTIWPQKVVMNAYPAVRFVSVAAGGEHTCATTSDHAAFCWGHDDVGQLGNGSTDDKLVPWPVSAAEAVSSLGAGMKHTCGVFASGLRCWGRGARGQLGNGSAGSASPIAVSGAAQFAQVNVGDDHACALTASGRAFCWGGDEWGEVGDGQKTHDVALPTEVTGYTFAALAAGPSHTCALTSAGAAYCWGLGPLGDGIAYPRYAPVAVVQ